MRKGFTLIELLAAILVLGIIAVVVIPAMNRVIEVSSKKTFQQSNQNLLESVEYTCSKNSLKGKNTENIYSVINGKLNEDIKVKGKLPDEVNIVTDSDCNTTLYTSNKKFCAVKGIEDNQVKIGKMIDGKCELDYSSIYTNSSCFDTENYYPSTYTIDVSGEKLNTCTNYFNEYFNYDPEYTIPTSDITNFCNGTGLIYDDSFQSVIDNHYLDDENYDFLESEGIIHEEIPNGVSINNYTCHNKVVAIPEQIDVNGVKNDVIEIKSSVFKEKGLKSVIIPNTVKDIGDETFANNELTTIVIPDSVISIGDAAFFNNKISYARISNNLHDLSDYLFYGNRLEKIELPDSITSIGKSTFEKNLIKEVVLPNNLITLGESSFRDNFLEEVEIPGRVTEISNDAFLSNKIKRLEISNGVTRIGEYAFAYNLLTNIIIPYNVNSIDYYAFVGNDLLTDIKVDDCFGNLPDQYWTDNKNIVYNQNCSSIIVDNSISGQLKFNTTKKTWFNTNSEIFVTFQDFPISSITIDGNLIQGNKFTLINNVNITSFTYNGKEIYKIESQHNYSNYLTGDSEGESLWSKTMDGANSINIIFSEESKVEDGWDYISLYDGSGNLIQQLSSTEMAGKTYDIPGDTIVVKLTSDSSSTYYGFSAYISRND